MTRARLITLVILAMGTGGLALPAAAWAADNTSTAVSCSPASVTTGAQTTCTATVSDTTAANTPTGTVDFSASPGGSINSCTLSAAGSCGVHFKPAAGGDYTVSAAYAGTSSFQPSTGTTSLTAVDPTTLSVSCSPSTVPLNSPTQCTASLTDPDGGPPPAGAVSFGFSPSTGKLSPAPPCQSIPGSATCQLTFTPFAAGGYTVTADYDPCPSSGSGGCDTHHAASSASTHVTSTTTPAGGGPGSHGGGSGGVTIPVTSGPPAPGTVSIGPRAKVSKRHFARVQLSCAGGSGSTCNGTLVLTTQIKVKVKVVVVSRKRPKKHHGKHKSKPKTKFKTEKKTILVGMVNYSLAAGSSKALSIKLKKGGVKALGRHRRLRVSAAAGSAARTVTLIGPKHKKKHHKKKHHHHKKKH
jgi:hypothetical protein